MRLIMALLLASCVPATAQEVLADTPVLTDTPVILTTVVAPPADLQQEAGFPVCPVEELRQAYRSLLSEEDTFNVLAVEEQVLLVCRERQELIKAYQIGVMEIAKRLIEVQARNQVLLAARGELNALVAEKTAITREIAELVAQRNALAPPGEGDSSKIATDNAAASVDAKAAQNSCELRYALIGTGKIKGKLYAMIVDEMRGESHTAYVGSDLPYGAQITAIEGTKVTILSNGIKTVLPVAGVGWTSSASDELTTDGVLWHKVQQQPGATFKPDPVQVQVFGGFATE